MDQKHTPGPWMVLPETGTERVGQFCILTQNGHRLDIASTYGWPDTPKEANALLMAASPELLASLIECANYIISPVRMSRDEDEEARRVKIHTRAREAIAKATGTAR